MHMIKLKNGAKELLLKREDEQAANATPTV